MVETKWMAARGIIKIPVVGAAVFIALLSTKTHGNHPFIPNAAKCSKDAYGARHARRRDRHIPGTPKRAAGFGWFCPLFYSGTVGKLSFLIALWIVAAGASLFVAPCHIL
jgi:hypothetical protein